MCCLLGFVGVVVSCGQGGEVDQGQPSSVGTGIGAAVPFRGATSLEERVANHPTVVKARLTSVSAEVVAGAERLQGSFYVVLKFNLSVSEYLKGSGGNSITAIRVVTRESPQPKRVSTPARRPRTRFPASATRETRNGTIGRLSSS